MLDDKKVCVTSPYSILMFNMRNDMEHNALRTVDNLLKENKKSRFTKYTTENQIEHNTFKLMKLLREALVYLSIAVNEDVKAKS